MTIAEAIERLEERLASYKAFSLEWCEGAEAIEEALEIVRQVTEAGPAENPQEPAPKAPKFVQFQVVAGERENGFYALADNGQIYALFAIVANGERVYCWQPLLPSAFGKEEALAFARERESQEASE